LLNGFNLYLGLDELINIFSDQNYVILFWVHFLAINLFCGSWIVKDYQRNNMPKFLVFFPLLLTYFIGPLGIFIYWFFRIFYSKKIDLYE
jgi:membrane protein insertase Oxa1/YidC/SpoIIIJ